MADIAGPVLLALVISVTASPLTGWLRRLGGPGWLATAATVVTVYIGLTVLGGSLVVSLARLVDLLPTYRGEFDALRADLTAALRELGVEDRHAADLAGQVEPGALAQVARDLLGGTLTAVTGVLLLLAVVLFMCLDAGSFPTRLAAGATRHADPVRALRQFARGTRRYLAVSTVFGLIVAVIDTLMLWALDVPLPVLWGLLAFATNSIPNVGFVIGLAPPALLGLLQGGPSLLVKVVVLYSVVNFVIQSIIQPKIVGDAVGLSATVSFLSLVFWAWVLGPVGALLAVPLSLLAKALLIDADPSTRWIGPLVSGGR
jgi:predicted PurR-regulated permease PerM